MKERGGSVWVRGPNFRVLRAVVEAKKQKVPDVVNRVVENYLVDEVWKARAGSK